MANLRINNLSKQFGKVEVINNISLDVREGEFCILLGPSGCGKTTVLRLIAGLEQQDRGEIYIGAKEVSNLTPKERDVAVVFQSYALYPHMNVYENMSFSLKIRKRTKEDIERKVREAAGLLEMDDLLFRKPKELSGGQRQRVAIGRAIVRNPELFLFDEPLSNLDAKLRATMRLELAKLHQKLKSTTLYVTHDQVEAMTLGEKIVLLDRGTIQQTGTPEELYNKPANLFVATFIGIPQINLLEGRLELKEKRLIFRSGKLTFPLEHTAELAAYAEQEIIMGIRPESLIPGEGPVEGSIELIERLGPETLIYFNAENRRLTAKISPDLTVKKGERMSFTVSGRGIHFFHKEKRLAL